MKICAIVCEYNPFHSGHLYQITKIPAHYDRRICIMSGNFVQRAEPAIVNKYVRAKAALNCGIDMIIENPVVNAVANGEKFAEGAIKTIKQLPSVKAIAMGCETENTHYINEIAKTQLEENDLFKDVLAELLGNGTSYAAAYCEATAVAMEQLNFKKEVIKEILSKPNNLLCIEYIKSIVKHNLDIEPILINRKGNDYNSLSVYGYYLSATALRKMLAKKEYSAAVPFLPENEELIKACKSNQTADLNLYEQISLYNLRNATTKQINELYDCKEGLEFSLKKSSTECCSLNETLLNVKSKRYTLSRLKRIVLQLNLGITKNAMNDLLSKDLPFRVLAIKNDFKPYLSDINKYSIIRNSDYEKHSEANLLFDIEKRANSLYSLLCNKPDVLSENLITDKLI